MTTTPGLAQKILELVRAEAIRLERTLHSVGPRLRSVFRRRRAEQDLDEEIRYHLEAKIQQYIGRGLTVGDARLAALREFGGIEGAKEKVRDVRRVLVIETLVQDVRYAVRTLRRNPGFTIVALLTLALGIGANTAIFSLVNGILLVPLPYVQPDRLVGVTGTYPTGAFVAMRDQITTMDVGAYAEGHELNLTGIGEPVRLAATAVSAELFALLGARPELGRTFEPGDDAPGRNQYVILSRAAWEQRFGRDPAIVGRSIVLEGSSREVVGVMPADFRFPTAKTQLWIPLPADPKQPAEYWAGDFMPVIARLHPGVTIEQARADVRLFQSRVFALFPWAMPVRWNADLTVLPLQNGMVADVRGRLLMLLGAVALVLLIACANVANLTLARAASREREIGIRAALGAGHRRIARQLLTESIVLASAGGALGFLCARFGLSFLKRALPADTPRLMDVQMDWRVLAFTGGLAVVTGVIFGLAPALYASRAPLAESLQPGGRAAALAVPRRLRSALVVAELAFAMMLVIAAGLLMKSFWALSRVNTGFRPEHVLTLRLTPSQLFCRDTARCLTFYRQALDRAHAAPGVSAAALVNTPPLGGKVAKRALNLQGFVVPRGQTSPLFWLNVVTPEYFRVMDIPVVSGRGFTDADWSGNPANVVVAAATARRFWSDEGAIGQQIQFVGETEWRTVVGVVADVRAYDLHRDVPAWIAGTVYVPYSPRATLEDGRIPSDMTMTVRTSGDESQLVATLRHTVAGLNQDVPVGDPKALAASLSDAVSSPAAITALFVAFAGLALALGLIGIYGVLSYLVSQRTREIGIRIALGATYRDVWWPVMREGLTFALAGIMLGLAGAFAVTGVLSGELYGVSPTDPATYAGVSLAMAVVTVLACGVPTYRAMRVDPLIALRRE